MILMEEKTLFSFKNTRLPLANYFVFLMLPAIPIGCIASIIGSALITFLTEKLFSLEMPSSFMLILFTLFLIGIPLYGFQSRLLSLIIDNEKLQWQTVWKKAQQINRNEIQKVQLNKRGQLILNDHLKFNPNALPQRERIEFGAFLPQWLPKQSLSPDYQEHLQWKQKLIENWQENEPFSITAHTNKQKSVWLRRIGFTGIMIFTGLIIWPISANLPQEASFILIFFGMIIFFTSIAVWKFTEYKSIQANEKGIVYQRGKKELFFAWHGIEVLAFRVGSQHLLIWQGRRYKSYSYSQIDLAMVNEVAKAIFEQAVIRNIPASMV